MIDERTNRTFLRRFLLNMDWMLIAAAVFLVAIGMLSIYSATLHLGVSGKFVMTQTLAIGIGLAGMIIFMSVNYQYFNQMMYFVLGASLIMLMSVLVFGTTIRGTKGWFNFSYFAFQPVEITKLMFVLVLAAYLDSKWRETRKLNVFFVSMLILMSHIFFIMLQPDFSSTLAYFPITFALLYLAGVQPIYLLGAGIFGGLAMGIPLMSTFFKLQPALLKIHPLLDYIVMSARGGIPMLLVLAAVIVIILFVWWFLSKLRVQIPFIYAVMLSVIIAASSVSSIAVQRSLKEYQRKRLIVFLKPDIDPLGSGYNIIQSKIAIGSGKIFGKGLFSGTQSQLGYLPEQHTDFVFSVIGEELGYFMAQLTIIFYFILVWRAMIVSRDARDRYGSMVAAGLGSMFAFYGVINIGMVMGLMPTTGLPLPLVSYGGSSMVSSLWAIGILSSVHMRRFTH